MRCCGFGDCELELGLGLLEFVGGFGGDDELAPLVFFGDSALAGLDWSSGSLDCLAVLLLGWGCDGLEDVYWQSVEEFVRDDEGRFARFFGDEADVFGPDDL